MNKLFVIISLCLLMLLPTSAWACGDNGQSPCGGECTWIVKGVCPFCIPWCHSEPRFCHAGNEPKSEYQFLLTGEVVGEVVCRPTAAAPPASRSVDQAVAAGCRSEGEVTALLNDALSRGDLGSKTRTKLSGFSSRGNWATKSDITDPNTWGYRAATIGGEEDILVQGRLTSKSERRTRNMSDTQVQEFWNDNGPRLPPADRSSTSVALQMLATASSDEPPSQFTSVALDYSVASGFGDIVYRFQLDPQSPLLGMTNCDKKQGEVQIQPRGGTPIRSLQRYDRRKNYWEAWKGGNWVRMDRDEL